MFAATHVNVLGNILHDIYDLLLIIKLQTFLGEIAKANSITNIKSPTVRSYYSQEHLDEGRLASTIIPYNTHLLETGEIIVEVL